MTGNANEWVRDWYSPFTYGEYEGPEQVNPTGPADGDAWNTAKLSRGYGRQHSDPSQINVFSRLPKDINKTSGTGFRCSIDTDTPPKKLSAVISN